MAKKTLKQEWDSFLSRLTPEERDKLSDAGFDLDDPQSDNLPMFHRMFATQYSDNSNSYSDNLFRAIQTTVAKREAEMKNVVSDPAMDFAVTVAARVIDAFDCSQSRDVKLHADCMRLAIGYPSCEGQKEIAAKYGESKAFISYRVRSIQKRLKLPLCAFNGNRTNR